MMKGSVTQHPLEAALQPAQFNPLSAYGSHDPIDKALGRARRLNAAKGESQGSSSEALHQANELMNVGNPGGAL